MSAPRRRQPQETNELEASLGRSLAETEQLNRPERMAAEQARRAVWRQTSASKRSAGRRRAFVAAVLILLALIGLVGLLIGISPG